MANINNQLKQTDLPQVGDYLVRFIDLDGTVLKEEWVNSGEDATPPNNPSYDSENLTFSSWNNSYSNITRDINIGATYHTMYESFTMAFITLTPITGLNVTLYLNKSDNSPLTVFWDGTNYNTYTNVGNFNTGAHTYPAYGDYLIQIGIVGGSGTYSFGNGSTSTTFCGGSTQSLRNQLTKVYIGSFGVTNINAYAFYNNQSVTMVSIPNSVTTIGNYAFAYMYSLYNIIIPSSTTSIGTSCFYGGYSLRTAIISNAVTSIGTYSFQSCTALTSIILPNITTLSASMFNGCKALVKVVLPSGLTTIGGSAFYSCFALTSITIPSSVTSIGSDAFYSCESLTSLIIPSGVTSISDRLCQNCYSLINVSIPSGVTSIGTYVFANCYSLPNVTIPNTVTSIGSGAFYYCYKLTNMSIPSSVTTIGSDCFSTCYSLIQYKFYRTTPSLLGNTNVFSSINSICKIYVPTAYVTQYKTATNWVTFADYIYPLSDIGE